MSRPQANHKSPEDLPSSLRARHSYNRHTMRRYFPDFDGFAAAARSAEVVPVYRQLLGDHLTPVTAFEVLGRDPHAFLLESVVGGERVARYSFIASAPAAVYMAFAGKAAITQR